MVKLTEIEITEIVRAVIVIGLPTVNTGMKPGDFLEAIIDPNMVSPSGQYLRFDSRFQKAEIHGWQRIDCVTVCEVLGPEACEVPAVGYTAVEGAKVTLRKVESWDA